MLLYHTLPYSLFIVFNPANSNAVSVCCKSKRENLVLHSGSIESDSLQDGMEETNYTLAQSSIPEMCFNDNY